MQNVWKFMGFNVIAVIYAQQKHKKLCEDLNLICKEKRIVFNA